MKKNIICAITTFLFFTLLFGIIYPFAMTGVASKIFPEKSGGSLIKNNEKVLGSKLIGQNFSDPKYLWGRISATSPSYNGLASSGSNLDWSNEKFLQNVNERIALLKKFDPQNNKEVPIDLVTASASGLDPEVSVDAALYQVSRIAKLRNISESKVIDVIRKYTHPKQFGLFGENRVNVLEVNLALDGKI